jgi:hypothetical protein
MALYQHQVKNVSVYVLAFRHQKDSNPGIPSSSIFVFYPPTVAVIPEPDQSRGNAMK